MSRRGTGGGEGGATPTRTLKKTTSYRDRDRQHTGDWVSNVDVGEGGGDVATALATALAAVCRASVETFLIKRTSFFYIFAVGCTFFRHLSLHTTLKTYSSHHGGT